MTSLEERFREAISQIFKIEEIAPRPDADRLRTMANQLDDILFRLQIWGSESTENESRPLSFGDIMSFKNSLLPQLVREVLEDLESSFATLASLLHEHHKIFESNTTK